MMETTSIEHFQERVATWVVSTFGEAVAGNKQERCLRLVEEALELSQVAGVDAEQLHKLIDYVYSRAVGDAPQEVAGCMVTLCAVAASLKVSVAEVSLLEADRIETPEIVAKCRRRQAEKREALMTAEG